MHTLLGTGLRREELVNLDLDQVTPNTPQALHAAKNRPQRAGMGKVLSVTRRRAAIGSAVDGLSLGCRRCV